MEVNSSFYRVPAVTAAKKWAERTPADFEFSLKLYQKFTHPDMFAKATGGDPSRLGRKDVDEFRAAIAPLAEAASWARCWRSFPPASRTSRSPAPIWNGCSSRSASIPWPSSSAIAAGATQPAETAALLAAFEAALAQIDEPKFRTSIRQNLLPNVKSFYYLRLHGRNAAQWWKHD